MNFMKWVSVQVAINWSEQMFQRAGELKWVSVARSDWTEVSVCYKERLTEVSKCYKELLSWSECLLHEVIEQKWVYVTRSYWTQVIVLRINHWTE